MLAYGGSQGSSLDILHSFSWLKGPKTLDEDGTELVWRILLPEAKEPVGESEVSHVLAEFC